MSDLFNRKVTMRKLEHPTVPGREGDLKLKDEVKKLLDAQLLERSKEIGIRNRVRRQA